VWWRPWGEDIGDLPIRRGRVCGRLRGSRKLHAHSSEAAQLWLREGSGNMVINRMSLDECMPSLPRRADVLAPLSARPTWRTTTLRNLLEVKNPCCVTVRGLE